MRKAKTSKKVISPKAPAKGVKRTSKKISAGIRRSREMVDEVLVKVSPQVQKRVDQLISTLHDTKEARMGDLKWLAGQILLRSRDISEQLKNVRLQKKSARAARPVRTHARASVVAAKASAKTTKKVSKK